MSTRTCSYVPATTVIDPTAPGGIDALLDFHGATFGAAVMEAGTGDGDDGEGDDGGPAVNEHGYPDQTPVKDMAEAHQLAYWRHHAKKHEARAKSYGDYDAIKAERDQLKAAGKTPDQKAADQALAEAEARGNAAALAAIAPRLVAAEFKAAGAGKIADAQLTALISGVHAPNFLTDSGEVDADKVTQYLAPFMPTGDGDEKKKWPDMGQGRRQQSKTTGVSAGADLHAARHSKKS